MRLPLHALLLVAAVTPAFAQNDECVNALPIGLGQTTFDTRVATPSPEPWSCVPGAADVWFTYTATSNDDLSIDTCVSATFDGALEVFTGTCGSLVSIACDDDACGPGSTSRVSLGGVVTGTTYTIRVGGYASIAAGRGILSVQEIVGGNDECASARPLQLGATGFDTSLASASPLPWSCATAPGPDLWYSVTASSNADLRIDTCLTPNSDTLLEAFVGACGALTPIACNDDACGLASSLTLTGVTSGTTYTIRLGTSSASGFGHLRVAEVTAANDECSGALPVGVGVTPFETCSASTTTAPAWSCGLSVAPGGVPDVWYLFTVPADGSYIVETSGSTLDTVLAYYTGTCGALNQVFCQDDQGRLPTSAVAFTAVAGETFHLRVGGLMNANDTGLLTITEQPSGPATLVAHYKLDDTGAICVDSSGNGLDGAYGGSPVLGQPGAASTTHTAFEKDSNADRADVLDDPLLSDMRVGLSVSAWLYTAANSSGTNTIFGNLIPGHLYRDSWAFRASVTGDLSFRVHRIQNYVALAVLTTDRWTHVAAVFDGGADVTFYVDGVSVGTVAGDAPPMPSEPHWIIGRNHNGGAGGNAFRGKLDDIQVYRGALTPGEVQILHSSPGVTVAAGAPGSGPLGVPYCTPNANSTGLAGRISAFGSALVADDDVEVTASSLPPGSFGFFLSSQTQGFVANPGVNSSGNLCLGGSIGRYDLAGQIMNSGPAGTFSLQLDLSQTPSPTGLVSVMAGEAWNFQAWHRDSVLSQATSNFTDAICVAFF